MPHRTVHICIPIARKQRTQASYERLLLMKESLLDSLRCLPKTSITFNIHAVINGPQTQYDLAERITSEIASIEGVKGVSQVMISMRDAGGKISVVNNAILEAKGMLGLIVIDDDIIVPRVAITEMTRYLSSRVQHARAFCFPKTSTDYLHHSNSFVEYQLFLLHPSVQRLLLKMKLFETNRRPCGSLYAIHQSHLRLFPDPCNEADIFKDLKIQLSDHFVRTWYPRSFVDEVARRKVHVLNRKGKSAGSKDSNLLKEIDSYETMVMSAPPTIPKKISLRIYKALLKMNTVLEQAAKEGSYGNDT